MRSWKFKILFCSKHCYFIHSFLLSVFSFLSSSPIVLSFLLSAFSFLSSFPIVLSFLLSYFYILSSSPIVLSFLLSSFISFLLNLLFYIFSFLPSFFCCGIPCTWFSTGRIHGIVGHHVPGLGQEGYVIVGHPVPGLIQ